MRVAMMLAVVSSQKTVRKKVAMSIFLTLAVVRERPSAVAVTRHRRLMWPVMIIPASEVRPMIPKPPIWISAIITACPVPLQWELVSTTASPVIDTAEVAVKNEVSREVEWCDADANGRDKSTDPTAIVARNPMATSLAGCR